MLNSYVIPLISISSLPFSPEIGIFDFLRRRVLKFPLLDKERNTR